MRVEIPIFTRACGCLPLRHGILLLGYLKLVFLLFEIGVAGFLFDDRSVVLLMFHGVGVSVEFWLLMTLYCLEAVVTLVLLVGCHMKKTLLITVFYYYSITTTIATVLMFIFVREDDDKKHHSVLLMECTFVFSGLVMQLYLLLLIRSELKKLKSNISCQLKFENHNIEAAPSNKNEEEDKIKMMDEQ